MAASIRSLFRLSSAFQTNTLLRNTLITVGVRSLYTEKSLGLHGYETARLGYRNQFMNVENVFRQKMKEVCNDEATMIFTEDLKAMLHLIQKKEEDLDLALRMVKKYSTQNNELRFGTFVFGPVVMRALYFLDEPDLALTIFKDPSVGNFFNQLTSIQILMSLLYKHHKYHDVLDVYYMVKAKNLDGINQRADLFILYMAACYEINTLEVYNEALTAWRDAIAKDRSVPRRVITFLSALALKQGDATVAFEVLSMIRQPRYIDSRCLKVLTYIKLGRLSEIIPMFKISLENDRPYNQKETYFKDVVDAFEQAIEQVHLENKDEAIALVKTMRENGYVNDAQTLEEHISSPIDIARKSKVERAQANFKWRDPIKRRQLFERSNLRDLL